MLSSSLLLQEIVHLYWNTGILLYIILQIWNQFKSRYVEVYIIVPDYLLHVFIASFHLVVQMGCSHAKKRLLPLEVYNTVCVRKTLHLLHMFHIIKCISFLHLFKF